MTRRLREFDRLRRVYQARRERGADDRYAPFTPANLFRLHSLERAVAAELRARRVLPWPGGRALDVGCGGGWWLRTLARWGVPPESLYGVDALPEAVAATRGVHPAVTAARGAADSLPFADNTFDLVSQFTVFSSILDQGVRRTAARELLRVLAPGGLLLWYDFTVNPTNRTTHGIGLAEAHALFPGQRLRATRLTLAPPLARLLAPRARPLAAALEALPLLRTHLLITSSKFTVLSSQLGADSGTELRTVN